MKFCRKKTCAHSIMLTLILTISATLTLCAPSVKAAPLTIDVSPPSAQVGSTIVVSGTNATPNGEVGIYVMGFIFMATTTADETGNYSVNVTAPAVPTGSVTLVAIDVETGDTASAPFDVEPRITLTPAQGSCYDEITVRGDGFQSGSNITLDFDGADVTPYPEPQTDFLGSFETTFTVPLTPNGTYTVAAEDLWANSATAEFTVTPEVTLWPQSSGTPSALTIINGYGYAQSVNITAHFGSIDITPYPTYQTSPDGSLSMPFFVPQVENGTYTVNVSDAAGNWATAPFIVGSPILTLTPDKTSRSSVVTATGAGFPVRGSVLLYLEDITMTDIFDLMWSSRKLFPDENGAFEYSFIMPITNPGTYTVTAYLISGPSPSEPKKVASATLTVVDDSALNIERDVGSIHFIGEVAEFYATMSHNGQLVDANIDKATLYYSDGASSQDLTADVEQVATGVYRIPYAIPVVAQVGTYTLVVEASYANGLVESFGASSASFLVSQTLTTQNAQIANIENNIATVVIPDLGTIKANLTALNAKLDSLNGTMATIQTSIGTINANTASIQLHVTSINGSVATIQTLLGTMHGNITSIDGSLAAIQTELGTIETDVGSLASEVTPSAYEISLTTLVLALIAAVGAMLTVILALRKKTPTQQTPVVPEAPQPPTPPEAPQPQTQP